jgi:hypothetical protein
MSTQDRIKAMKEKMKKQKADSGKKQQDDALPKMEVA